MRLILLAALSLSSAGVGRASAAILSSTNFGIPTENYNAGGGAATSTNYQIYGDVGDVIGPGTSTNFAADAGHIYTLSPGFMSPAGCGVSVNVKQDGTGDALTIQSGVNALPASLVSNACVVIRDTQTYNEQVTIQGIASNNNQIIIMADPSFVTSLPVVNPPLLSTAAFQVINTSVTIQHITVSPTHNVPYGIVASSDEMILSAVGVFDAAGNIAMAGVQVSSYSTIQFSTISVKGSAVILPGTAVYNTVSFSSITSINNSALNIAARFSNISQDFIAGGSNDGVTMGGANNTITNSTMTSVAAAHYALSMVGNAVVNSVNQSYLFNPAGSAVGLLNTSNTNTITLSTMTSYSAAGGYALFVNGYANQLLNDVISNPFGSAVDLNTGSYLNLISQGNISGKSGTLPAVLIVNSSSNNIVQSTISNPLGQAVTMSGDNLDTISQSTVTAGGGIFPAVSMLSSSDTIDRSYIQGAPAIATVGSTNTVVDGSVLVTTKTFAFVSQNGVGLSVTTSTILGGTIVGVNLSGYNMGVISFTSDTITSGGNGLWITTQAAGSTLYVSSLSFVNLTPGATAIYFMGGVFNSTFSGVAFDNSVGVNVNAQQLIGGSVITMSPFSGPKVGPSFDIDPQTEVFWPGFTETGLPGGCASGFFVKLGGGADYTSITAALNHLPTNLVGGDDCVVISDTQTYNEQVTVQGFTNNNFFVRIMSDPTFVSSAPAVNPPVLISTAAFEILNASVSIQHIFVAPTHTVAYGIYVSSNNAAMSGINVLDPAGNIAETGIALASSQDSILRSTISVQLANAVTVGPSISGATVPSSFTLVGFSSMTSGGFGLVALGLYDSQFAIINHSFMSVPSGLGATLQNGSGNQITFSTMTSNALSYYALDIDGEVGDSMNSDYMYNPSNGAVYLENGAALITISGSQMVSDSSSAGLTLDGVSSNTITGAQIFNPPGVGAYLVNGSSNNSIVASVLTVNTNTAYAVGFDGVSSNTVESSFMSNPGGPAAYMFPSTNNTIDHSTMTSNVVGYGALTIDGSTGNAVTQSYIGNPGGLGVYVLDGSSGNVISGSSMYSNVDAALVFNGVTGNTVTQSLMNSPGYYGAWVDAGSMNNEISLSNITGGGLSQPALYVQGSTNTFTQDFVTNSLSTAVWVDLGANGNIISYTTMTTFAPGASALEIFGAFNTLVNFDYAQNTVPGGFSYGLSMWWSPGPNWVYSSQVQGTTGIDQSTSTFIGGSLMAANTVNSPALILGDGGGGTATNTFLTTSTVLGEIYVGPVNGGVITLTSNTVTSGKIGVDFANQPPITNLSIASMTFQSLAAGATAFNFDGGTVVSTFGGVSFDNTVAVNVNATLLTGSTVTIFGGSGPRGGPLFDHDPFGEVVWPGNVYGHILYNGTVASGTVHEGLFYVGGSTKVTGSNVPFGTNVTYDFGNVPAGAFNVRAFIDLNGNSLPDVGEPFGESASAGFGFNGATLLGPTVTLCDDHAISVGQTISATITPADCTWPDQNGAYARLYSFPGTVGQIVNITANALNFGDVPIRLYDSSGTLITSADGGAGTSMIPNFPLLENGPYIIEVSAFNAGISSATFNLSIGAASGVISGSATYTGAQGGKFTAALFSTPPTSSTATLVQAIVLPGPGPFFFNSVISGASYYIGAFVDVNGSGKPVPGDDFGAYGGTTTPTEIFLPVAGSSTGITFAIIPASTATFAVVGGSVTYAGPSTGALHVELWGNPTFSGSPAAARNFGVVTTTANFPYAVPAPGGVPYFARAWIDINGTLAFAANDPSGFYSPLNQGAQQVFAPVAGSTSNINFSILDPGFSANGFAGEGSASMIPANASAGASVFTTTLTYTAGLNGINAGGQLGFTFPPGFAPPLPPPTGAYYAITSTVGIAFPIPSTDGPVTITTSPVAVLVTIPGPVAIGQQINLIYTNGAVSCSVGIGTFTVSEAQKNTVTAAPLFSGSPDLQVVPGAAAALRPLNPTISLTEGVLSDPQSMTAFDSCGNATTVASVSTATLSGVVFNVAQSTFVPDSSVSFATATTIAGASPFSVIFGVGQSSAAFYAIATSSGVKNIKAITYLGNSATFYYALPVLPSNALTGVAVSTASNSVGQSSATITPNGGAVSTAYVNFTLGSAAQPWDVMVSSVPFKVGVAPNPVWETWGSGQPNLGQIAWDGRYSPSINGGARVPSGTYYVRIEVAGGGVHDDSLIIVVSVPQISGQSFDGSGGTPPFPPLPGASFSLFGANGSFATQSDAGGNYVFSGLAAGVYNMFVAQSGFNNGTLSVTLGAAGTVSTFTALTAGISGSTNAAGGIDVDMTRAATLFVAPSVATNTATADQWGTLQVRTSTSIAALTQATLSAPLHLAAGTTTFDDGGQWDPSVGSFIVHTLFKFAVSPATYTVSALMPGFSISSANVSVAAGVSNASLTLTPQSSISGLVTIGAGLNLTGTFVSVNAVPLSSAAAASGGGGGVFVPGSAVGAVTSSTYTIPNISGGVGLAGLYLLRASANGLQSLSSGPISVPVSSNVTHVDFGTLGAGASIGGVITFSAGPPGNNTQVSVNAWSPGALSLGTTNVFVVGAANTVAYNIQGLTAGAVYQVFLNVVGGNGTLTAPQPSTTTAPNAAFPFAFTANTGAIAGTIIIPAPNVDFSNVSFTRQTVASVNPPDVGNQITFSNATTLPGFAIVIGSTATFTLSGLNTETDQITVAYATTGQTKSFSLSATNGATTPAFIDLSSPTYSISGSINNQITNALFNTDPNIVQNSTNVAPSGYPASLSSTTARVEAVLQNLSNFSVAISTVFAPATSRVGFLTAAGTFTITNVPSGAYFVRTVGLVACTTCAVLVPSVGQIVDVAGASVSSVTLTLTDGFSVSGQITLAGTVLDARVFNLTVTDQRQNVIASTSVYLGDTNLNLYANSVNYSFSNLPAGGFYNLNVVDAGSPAKYVGQPISFPNSGLSPNGLQSSLSNQNVVMQSGAFIAGSLQDANTGAIINATNANLLAPNFQITATADPWVTGGFAQAASSVAARPIQGDGTFLVGPLIPGITYDLKLSQLTWDPNFLANGSQNYAPVTRGSLVPQSGTTLNVGVISLNEGQSLSGNVYASTTTGALLGNIEVTAQPSFGNSGVVVQTYTNQNGHYNLWVSTYIANQYDVSAAPRGGNLASNGTSYTEVTQYSVNLLATTTADFVLNPLIVSVTGQVLVADAATGGALSYPFGAQLGFPAAAVFMQSTMTVASVNPFGDISAITDTQGNFSIAGISTGTYSLNVVSQGYAVFSATVTASTSTVVIYHDANLPANYYHGNLLTLQRGATVTGRILKSDGSAPNNSDVGGIAAANFASGQYLVGSVNVDPVAKTVNSYSISGFKPGISYNIVIIPANLNDDTVFPPEGANVSFSAAQSTATQNINLTFSPSIMECAANSVGAGNSTFQITVTCNKTLRNQTTADNYLNQILTISTFTSVGAAVTAPSGTGVLDPTMLSISADRTQITGLYRANTTDSEANFSLRVRATASTVNPQTGTNFTIDRVFDFFVGLNSHVNQRIGNISGGSVLLQPSVQDELLGNATSNINVGVEHSRLDMRPGTFDLCQDAACTIAIPASATTTITVGIAKAANPASAIALATQALGYVPSGAAVLKNPNAYPSDMAAAMAKFGTLDASSTTVGGANPLSAFYGIFLPAGIRHELQQLASVTMSYSLKDSTSTSPDSINVYFYNTATGQYVLENTNRVLDTVNQTITVSVDHFSTFVVLDGQPAATGANPFNRPNIVVANIPNPFDCITHAGFQQNALFGTSFVPSYEGTMIRFSLPTAGVTSGAEIRIFDLAGELVRDMAQGDLAGGFTYYTPWNCTNGSGRRVASGVYIGDLQWNGQHQQFKMAVIKGSGL